MKYDSEILMQSVRSGFVDAEYGGYLILFDKTGKVIESYGNSQSRYPFFLRSLAKPIQASILIDEELKLTEKEYAVVSGSHAGEKCHVETVIGILKRFNLKPEVLKCGYHPPLCGGFTDGRYANLYNNCSGKHAGMLALCVKNKWDTETYLNPAHPIQQLIYKQHQKFSETENLTQTIDGCGAPVWGMPLKNMAKSYLNLFFDDGCAVIKNAFLNFPYLAGGIHRLDTEIMQSDTEKKLISKVGAGGLIIVLNLKSQQLLLLKVSSGENHARALIIQEALRQLKWTDIELFETEIKTIDGRKIGEYNFTFIF